MVALHDSGERTLFNTGAMRDTAMGKPEFSVLATTYIRELLKMSVSLSEGLDRRIYDRVDDVLDDLVDTDTAELGYDLNPVYGDFAPYLYLVPDVAIRRVAAHYGKGANKYSPRNWEKGIPLSRYFDSLMRHMLQWANGDRREDHLAAALFNVMGILFTEIAVLDGEIPPEIADFGWLADEDLSQT